MAISIVIVNFNGQKWLGDCLRSIRSQKIKNLEVIIVDNNSTDDSVKIVAREYPDAKVIKNKTNLGFGRGNNLGAKKATSELLFFLNNDTLLQPNCLREVERQVHLKHLDLASPKLLNFSNVDFYKGRKLTLDIVGSLSWGKKITMIEGCGLIIKKKVFESLGGFDSSFFMYSEDLDLCWRAWLCGYKIKMINTASINHFGGGTSLPTTASVEKHVVPLFRRYETEKNTIRMMLKNATIAHLTIAIPLMFFLIVGESILYICTGQFTAARNLYMAIGWNFTHISETIVERRMVQAKKVKPSIWPLLAKKITKFEVLKLIGVPKIKI